MKLTLKQLILIGSLLTVLVLFMVLFKLPYTVKSPCRFVAQGEWSLSQLEPDKLSARLVRNDSNKVQSFRLLQFDRQDFIQFALGADIHHGLSVQKGQPIGNIVSSENQLRLANLLGELEKARANLDYLGTGEKKSVQAEARQALEYAKAELAAFLPELKRKRQLYEQALISKEEWEIAEANHELYKLNIALQEARLNVVQSGEKAEGIQLIEADASRLEDQIEVMQQKLAYETVQTPISGVITDSEIETVLCRVSKIDTIVIQIPVEAEQRKYLEIDQRIKIHTLDGYIVFMGTVDAIGNRARMINGRPMFIVTSQIENPERKLLPGMTGYAKIYCEQVTLFERIRRAWNLYIGAKFLF